MKKKVVIPPVPIPVGDLPEEFASVTGAENKVRPEAQPHGSYFQNRLLPQQVSTVQISGGQNIPFSFYLGSNSTIPFVRVENPYTQKELSWGELITIPPGQAANIRNISYMPGDLQIQSGNFPPRRPARTTIPVEIGFSFPNTQATTCTPKYPCDTRTARRAYFVMEYDNQATATPLPTAPFAVEALVRGRFQQHTKNREMPWPEAYIDFYQFTDERPNVIPLGVSMESGGGVAGGSAMRLADYCEVMLRVYWEPKPEPPEILPGGFPNVAHIINCYYVLEY